MPTIDLPLFAFLVTMMNQTSNSFITKLDSFILQRYAKFLKQCLNLIITYYICTKCGDILLQFTL